jgi:hypothetical protein
MSSWDPKESIKEVEEVTFSMREELKEAAAAVEECYRRRAKKGWAGGDAASRQTHDGGGA